MWYFINQLISPKKFIPLATILSPWLMGLFLITFSYGLVAGFILAPSDYLQGEAYRIIYLHVPAAFLSLTIYAIMAVAAFCGMIWRLNMAYLVMRESAPIGAAFTLLALITGSLWGKPMWGTWWLWDARLTSELILLFLYLGFLLFQSALVGRHNADKILSLIVLVGFLDIPIIHYSVYWWNTLHQGATIRLFAASSIDSRMLYPLLSMVLAFFIYYGYILFLRLRVKLLLIKADQ